MYTSDYDLANSRNTGPQAKGQNHLEPLNCMQCTGHLLLCYASWPHAVVFETRGGHAESIPGPVEGGVTCIMSSAADHFAVDDDAYRCPCLWLSEHWRTVRS